MEKIIELPKEFLIEFPINEQQREILIDQINRFNQVKSLEIFPSVLEQAADGRVLLKKGTLIHGTSGFDLETIEHISKTGILSGQAVGIPEDGETFFCADFHMVSRDMSMKEFNEQFKYVDGRCPFGNGRRGANALAFVIEQNDEAHELLEYDCYKSETVQSDITKSFVNVGGLPGEGDVLSSILYGVPSNLFSGIVLGNNLLEKKEIIKLLIKLFPDCYISSIDGVIIYNPSIDMNYNETVELRAEKYCLNYKKTLLELSIKQKEEEFKKMQSKYQTMVDVVIKECSSDVAARVLLDNGLCQGTLEYAISYVESIRESLGKSK